VKRYTRSNSFRVPVTGAQGQRDRIALVEVEPEEATTWRITLGPLIPFVPGSLLAVPSGLFPQWGNVGPKAFVAWGDGQAQHFAAVDWGPLGRTFEVHGYYVEVDFASVSAMILPVGSLPIAAATIVPSGAREGKTRPPTLTRNIALVGGVPVAQEIPQYARRLRWWNRGAAAGTTMTIRFLDDLAGATVRYTGGADFLANMYETAAAGNRSLNGYDGIDIPAYAAIVEYTASAGVTIQTEYELDLG
jgi:hypothetical protein